MCRNGFGGEYGLKSVASVEERMSREMAQSKKYTPHKYEDLGLIPGAPGKRARSEECHVPVIPELGRGRNEDPCCPVSSV